MAALTCTIVLASAGAIASSFNIIYTFQGGQDGAQPVGPLLNIGGILYGATTHGGKGCDPEGCGTIFSLTTSGTENILYKFIDVGHGVFPYGLQRSGNAMIGATYVGDSSAYIFSVTTKGKFTRLAHIASPQWPSNRRALTKIGNTWYGVDGGTGYSDCSGGACGYVFAVKP